MKKQLNEMRNKSALARYACFLPGDVLSFEFESEVYLEIPVDIRSKKKIKLHLKTCMGSVMTGSCDEKLKIIDGYAIQECSKWENFKDIDVNLNDESYLYNNSCYTELSSLYSTLKSDFPLGSDGKLHEKIKQLEEKYGNNACRIADKDFGLFGSSYIHMTFFRADAIASSSKSWPTIKDLQDNEEDKKSCPSGCKKKFGEIQCDAKTVRNLYGEWRLDIPKMVNDQDITEKCKFINCRMLPLQLPIKLGPCASTRKRGGRLQFAGYPPHAYETVKYFPLVLAECPPNECDESVAHVTEIVANYLLGTYTSVKQK